MSQKTVINLILGVALLAATCFGFACSGTGDEKLADSTADGSSVPPASASLTLASGDVTLDERVRIIKEHSSGGDSAFSYIILNFDSSGERAPMEVIPGGEALQVAAMYYSISTLDFNVSLADIKSAGYWPFDNFPTEVNDDMLVYDCMAYSPVMSITGELAGGSDVDSARWIAEARRVILRDFYLSCNSDWEAKSLEHLEKINTFWLNPFTELEMQYSSNPGDLYQMNFGSVVGSMPFSKPKDYSTELLLDFINQIVPQSNNLNESSPDMDNFSNGKSFSSHSEMANPCMAYSPGQSFRGSSGFHVGIQRMTG